MNKKVTIIMGILLSIFLIIMSILIIDYENVRSRYKSNIITDMQNEEEQISKFIYNVVNPVMGGIKNTASFISKTDIKKEKDIKDIMKTMEKGIPLINNLYFRREEDKKVIYIKNNKNNLNKIDEERIWTSMAKKSKDVIITPAYKDNITSKQTVTIAVPVYQEDILKGIVAADIYIDNMSELIDLSKVQYDGYRYVVDCNGVIIIHNEKRDLGVKIFNKKELQCKSILDSKIKIKDRGVVEYSNYRSRKVVAYYHKIPNLEWYVINTVENQYLDQLAMNYVIKNMMIASIVFISSFFIYIYVMDEFYYKDRITKLGNREKIKKVLRKRIRKYEKNKKDIIFINFKIQEINYINQKYGQEFHNLVLKEIGSTMQNKFKNLGCIARTQTDNFCMIFKSKDWNVCIQDAKKIEECFNYNNFIINGKNVGIKINMFLTKWDKNLKDDEEIIAILEDNPALEEQNKGKSLIIFEDMKSFISYKRQNENKKNELLNWMIKDRIVPFFQPIYDIKNNCIEKYEVLMRINANDKYLSPYEYIVIAEENDLIRKLDRMVIKKALKYKYDMKEMGRDFNVSINISPKEINEAFLNEIYTMVKDYNLDTEKITFEITETADVNRVKGIKEILSKYKKIGFKIAIDDIGTGFSNMNYLKDMVPNYIKIDGTFIRDIEVNYKSYYIASAFQNLAKAFKSESIGEFVENEKIFDIVKELRIDYAQGYYIGKPKNHILSEEEEKKLIKKITKS